MALRGRESLIRLVGKRRRFLPNRQSLLSTPLSSGRFDLCIDDKDGKWVSLEEDKMNCLKAKEEHHDDDDEEKCLVETPFTTCSSSSSSSSEWVTCPVCGVKVRAVDYMVNSHLDACLSRGTKRKLTQRTLLQFNFCSQSMAQISTCETKKMRSNSETAASNESLVQNSIICNENSDSVQENNSSFGNLPLTVETILGGSTGGLTEKLVNADLKICQVDSSLSLKTEVSKKCAVAITVDDVVGVVLGTFIVGRRYSLERDLELGASISLLRDPNNAKDPHAIKVLSADSLSCRVLGFLPRELAQYLSPLIEKYFLAFEGSVTSVPKHSFDAVPIQILCKKGPSLGGKGLNETEAFTCLWKNVICVVESMDSYSPNTTRYQRNFCLLIQEVIKSNPHHFSVDEKKFIESFFRLSDDSQRLFIRLYTRKGPWFQMSSVFYPEVLDSQRAVKELSAMDYMCYYDDANEIQDDDMKDLLDLLTVSELREIMCTMRKSCTRGGRKRDLIASILSSYEGGECTFLPSSILDRTGTCIKISSKAESLVWRAERLFFLNGEQDLSAFLLVDLGILKYPSYSCIITEPIFSSRSDILAYEEALELAQIMDESLDKSESEPVLKCMKIAVSQLSSSSGKEIQSTGSDPLNTSFVCFSAPWVYSNVIFVGISFLEHERRYREAIDLLKLLLLSFPCDGRRGYWTLRLSIDLEHVGCHNESLSVAEDGLLDPWVRAGSRMALQRRVLRLAKPPRRWRAPSFSNSIKRKIREVHIQGRPLNCEIGMKSRFYGHDGEQCGVEELALQYYAGEGGGWHGVHTESGIWLTIFGLLMWDIIFSDVPNVFRNKFQTAPLDLESDSFYPARRSLLESRLQEVQDGMAEEILISSWETYSGVACRGVKWDRHSLPELRAAVNCIGGSCLASLCRNLAQDYRSWSSGMPDLLLWRFHGEYRGEAKLVEVKGPTDRLSEQQRAWLLLLMDCGFDTEICKVKHC